ncbi:IS3 family transposase, partial [Limosilactobacillus reuteri]|uniref:IS3 family transposase n=1 Tax=Limosilactobacillus reuteri TaxID=1598 RepID=UPI001CDAD47B
CFARPRPPPRSTPFPDTTHIRSGPDTSYRNQEELSQAINEWIHFYNERRIQTKLGNQTPLQYEQNLVA